MTKFAGNNMMRTAAVLLCSAALVLPALAQSGTAQSGGQGQMQGPPPDGRGPGGPGGPGGRRGGPEGRLRMMQHELSLTPDQTAKIQAILEQSRVQRQADIKAQQDSTASHVERRAAIMADVQAENAKIKAVLNADQVAKLDAMEARMQERMRERREGGPGGPPPPPQQ